MNETSAGCNRRNQAVIGDDFAATECGTTHSGAFLGGPPTAVKADLPSGWILAGVLQTHAPTALLRKVTKTIHYFDNDLPGWRVVQTGAPGHQRTRMRWMFGRHDY